MMHDACVWNDVWLAAHKILLEQNERPDKAMDESEREGDWLCLHVCMLQIQPGRLRCASARSSEMQMRSRARSRA